MLHLKPLVLLVTIASVLVAKSARAQSPLESGTWLVSPAIGIALDPDADVSPTVAAAFGVPLTDSVAAEGELGYLFDMAPGDADVDSSLTTVHAAVLYFFDSEFAAVPYIAAGIGLGRLSHEVTVPAASIDQTEIGFNLGAGVTYPVADRMWVRGDFRYFTHIDDVPSAWRFSGGVTLRIPD